MVIGGRSGISGAALIAGNLIPLAGVLFAGWRAGDVVLLYWIENLIVGVLNIPRILIAQVEPGEASSRVLPDRLRANAPAALFFVLHYGLFCAVHGMALVELFGAQAVAGSGASADDAEAMLAMLRRPLAESLVLAGLCALFASHLFSFFFNYVGRGEFRRVDAGTMVERPYRRIMVVQVFAIAGGALLQYSDSPAAAIVVFVVVKIAIDHHMHGGEREVLAGAAGATEVSGAKSD